MTFEYSREAQRDAVDALSKIPPPDELAIAHVYSNTGDERDDFPWAVALDDHEPMGLFTEHAYALAFAGQLIDVLRLGAVAIVDKEKPRPAGCDCQ